MPSKDLNRPCRFLSYDVAIDVNPRPSGGQSIRRKDDSSSTFSSIDSHDVVTGFFCTVVCIAVIAVMLFSMTGVFFLPWLVFNQKAQFAICGCYLAGEVISLITLSLRPCLGKNNILAFLNCLGRLLSFITYIALVVFAFRDETKEQNDYGCWWFVSSFISQIIYLMLLIASFTNLEPSDFENNQSDDSDR
jgi:hypothetical protein